MTKPFEIIRKTRLMLLESLKDFSVEQLNKVPEGFNNNIIWNLAHLVSAQQGVCYTRAGLDIVVDDKYFTPYRPGTKPGDFIDSAEVDNIKKLMLTSIDKLEEDYNNNIFTNYTPWTTRYGVELATIEDALIFLPFHDGLHSGVITAMKKSV